MKKIEEQRKQQDNKMKAKDLKINRIDYKPLILSAVIIIVDQITKLLVIKNIPIWTYPNSKNSVKVLGDFLTFIHVRNLGAGFSVGSELNGFLRALIIFIVPIFLMIVVAYAVVGGREKFKFNRPEVYFLSLILGGGCGTLIDRFIRTDGVVDFISVKLYGFLGMEYWPTFNISDSAVVVGVIGMLIAFTVSEIKNKKSTS